MNVEEFAKEILGIELNDYQKIMLGMEGSRRVVDLPRCEGKTTMLMVYALAVADEYDGAKIALSTYSQQAANQRKVTIAKLVNGSDLVDRVVASYSGAIQFKNGSTIEILHHASVVQPGCRWDMILADDVSFYRNNFYEKAAVVTGEDAYIFGATTLLPYHPVPPREYNFYSFKRR